MKEKKQVGWEKEKDESAVIDSPVADLGF